MNNLFDLTGKIVVITGGAGLIGQEIVRCLSEYNAKIYLAEIDEKAGRRLAEELGDSVEYIFLDITNETSIRQLIYSILKKEGKIDVWINNAYPRTADWGNKLEDISIDSWRKNIDMHLNAYCVSSKLIAEQMKIQHSGSVINFSSIYGMVGPNFSIYEGTEMTMPAAYSVIKAGIINFTHYLASYYGEYQVRFNCISPGGIFNNQSKAFVDKYEKLTPLKRMGKSNELNGAVIFLASDASSFVTGHNLVVDGGWTCI